VPTRDGKLYEVDMRLRPSGSAGPVAVSLASFELYHREAAWTWERLALTRARVVAGPARLRRRVQAAIRRALRAPCAADVLADTAAMRARVHKNLAARGALDIKLREGGLLDVEFCVQALQLQHARSPGVLRTVTRDALAALARTGALPAADAALLIDADRIWRSVQGLLRIMHGRAIPAALTLPLAGRIARATSLPSDPEALAAALDGMAARVRNVCARILGETDAT